MFKKDLFKLLKKILVVVVLVAIIDFVAGFLFSSILYKSKDGRYYKAIYTFNRANEDILMLGSSKAETNFASPVFEEKLNISCWNAGRGGQDLPYFRCVQEVILKRHKPKILVLNLNKYNLEGSRTKNEPVTFLKPFYWDYPEIRPFINQISSREKYFMYSNLYAFNSTFYYLLRSFFIKGIDGETKDKGWKPRPGKMSIDPDSDYKHGTTIDDSPIDSLSFKEFSTIISEFKKHGTDIYVVISPEFQPGNETSTMFKLKEMANENYFNLLDYSNDTSIIYKPELFADYWHLNSDGAVILSNKIANEINKKFYLKSAQKLDNE